MVRYAKGHKDESRARILDCAAARFRADGIAATGLTGIMSEAGLTNGAFYSHFQSKDDLVRQGMEKALDEQLQRLTAAASVDTSELVAAYLSAEHRDAPETGCPSAAFLPEIARLSPEIREAYTTRLRALITELGRRLPQGDDQSAMAIGVLGALVGTMQLARAVDDRSLSDAILAAGVRAANILADVPASDEAAK